MRDATALAESLERHLGDPNDPDHRFSFARSAELDRSELFPGDACRLLTDWGMQHQYVPAWLGGELTDFQAPVRLIRAVARRDLTVAIAHGKTFLGGVCAWLVEPTSRVKALARDVLAGHPVSWALTERDHGSDLLATEVRAAPVPGGYHITGEKWLINNATRGRYVTVLTRTHPDGGSRGFDVLLVDKEELSSSAYECLPAVRLHGIRGADISGITFHAAHVDDDCLLGEPGKGLETVLHSLQLTRTLCAGLSLGAGDHALALAMRFAAERTLYGRRLLDLPQARRTLLDAYADHLLSEALVLVGTRAIHDRTEEMSVISAVVKYLVPWRTDATLDALGQLLGARSQLVADFADGQFQKLHRDHRIVAIFDGNSLVNLHALVNQFPILARKARAQLEAPATPEAAERLAPDPAAAPFDPTRLSLVAQHGSSLLGSLPTSVRALADLAAHQPSLAPVAGLAHRVLERTHAVVAEMTGHRPSRHQVAAETFLVAEEFALCCAAAAALELWIAHQPGTTGTPSDPLWQDAHWLHATLRRVLEALAVSCPPSPQVDEALFDALTRQTGEGWSTSLLPQRTAEGISR
ncbi:acyl-CoA dehydrogenase [Lipingzhangella sp. LS1_29]|uniref:Acyl-CoA dehydrogenase n=1 Tax=Lipingzhangella rawalii TaxID=2055835 RepID=A0ABU2H6H9_9ACTN|nr:acyl-CoA dehydrogenase [Lipingzhangella rawalii]MDS1270907.1 acyl-CoA dehydrogenase [Lipingzhangella rawalii]